jgi:nucleoid DNA-binding protein
MITNLKNVPVANERLLKETTMETKEDKKKVEEVIKFVGTFIAATISRGDMEGVMIPHFGKFKPKHKLILTKKKVINNRKTGMDMLYRVIAGKKVIDRRDKTDTDETI